MYIIWEMISMFFAGKKRSIEISGKSGDTYRVRLHKERTSRINTPAGKIPVTERYIRFQRISDGHTPVLYCTPGVMSIRFDVQDLKTMQVLYDLFGVPIDGHDCVIQHPTYQVSVIAGIAQILKSATTAQAN